jgi:hypothetical protein
LLAADVSPSISVLIDRYKHRLRIQFFDKEEQSKNIASLRAFEDMQLSEQQR